MGDLLMALHRRKVGIEEAAPFGGHEDVCLSICSTGSLGDRNRSWGLQKKGSTLPQTGFDRGHPNATWLPQLMRNVPLNLHPGIPAHHFPIWPDGCFPEICCEMLCRNHVDTELRV